MSGLSSPVYQNFRYFSIVFCLQAFLNGSLKSDKSLHVKNNYKKYIGRTRIKTTTNNKKTKSLNQIFHLNNEY